MTQINLDGIDFLKVCRACMSRKDDLFMVFDPALSEGPTSVAAMLSECTMYKVKQYDKLPPVVCATCLGEVRSAFRFKRKCESSYRSFLNLCAGKEIEVPNSDLSDTTGYLEKCTQTLNSSLYPCELCNYKFFSSDDLKSHRARAHKGSEITCRFCVKTFTNISNLKAHMGVFHPEQGFTSLHECHVCKRQLTRREHLRRHLKQQHNITEIEPFYAEGSNFKPTSDNDQGEVEVPQLKSEKSLENIDTVYCEPPYSASHDNVKTKIKREKIDNENKLDTSSGSEKNKNGFQCRICEKVLSRKDHLKRHMSLKHSEESDNCNILDEPEMVNLPPLDTNAPTYNNHDCAFCPETEPCVCNSVNPISNVGEEINIKVEPEDIQFMNLSLQFDDNSMDENDDNDNDNIDDDNDDVNDDDNDGDHDFDVTQEDDDDDSVGGDGDDGGDDFNSDEEKFNAEPQATTSVMHPKKTDHTQEMKCAEVTPKKESENNETAAPKKSTPKKRASNSPKKITENRCNQCQRTFSRHCHLLRHMLSHRQERPHKCKFCDKSFIRSDHLKKHVDNVHHQKVLKCIICDFVCNRNDLMTAHKKDVHGIEPVAAKLYPCEFCNKNFTSNSYMQKHKLQHTERIFVCKHCDAFFPDKKQCKEHEKTHGQERKFLCSMCGESFQRNDYLRVHMRRHTGEKPYKCKYCDKRFPRATDVNMHERYHTGKKPNVCSICGKAFHRSYNLTIHMRTHTGERPYQCTQCPKSFAQSNDLKAHIRRHTGERFKCNICDAGFLQLYHLRQHNETAHGIISEAKHGRLLKVTTPPPTQSQAPVEKTITTPPTTIRSTESALATEASTSKQVHDLTQSPPVGGYTQEQQRVSVPVPMLPHIAMLTKEGGGIAIQPRNLTNFNFFPSV